MNVRVLGILVLILLIVNFVSVPFAVQATKVGESSPPSENVSASQDGYSASSETTKNLTQTDGPNCRLYEWNHSSLNEWSKIAYTDGNKTRLVVGVNDENNFNMSQLNSIAVRHDAIIASTVTIRGRTRAVVVELLFTSVPRFVQETQLTGLADYIEPNLKIKATFTPNDPYWTLQWGPKKIEADWAWNTTVGSSDLLVAVIDTGIDYNHPDLAPNYLPLGHDWANNDPDPRDDYGHGTHCAGIIAATMNNNIGIAGVAQVKIMAEKVLDSYGYGYADWFAQGVINATDSGAKILSISLGGYGDSELMHDSLKYAYDAGVLVIVAAGNENSNIKPYPAGYPEVVAIAATDQDDRKASFSNWGDWVELAAPGVHVYSTMPTYHVTLNDHGCLMNYDFLDGTSMACPHVAGAAALVWSRFPSKSRDWVRLWLRTTSDDLGSPGFDGYYGFGRVNARRGVEYATSQHELEALSMSTPPYVKPREQGIINSTVFNFGESDEMHVTAQLWINDTIVSAGTIDYLATGTFSTISLPWSPTVQGIYNVTAYFLPVAGETRMDNNAIFKYVYVGNPVKAVVLHSSGNVQSQSITTWQELNSQWHLFGDTMIYIDYTSLNKDDISYADLGSSEADVLIISCAYDRYAGWEFTDSEIAAIKRYVYEGHGLIVTAGTLYEGVPNNNKFGSLLGLAKDIRWTTAYTDLLETLNASHPVFYNVPDPLIIPRQGTAIPSDGSWDASELVNGKYLALGHYLESAIVAHAGLVYISPWLEVIPPYYKHHLQLLYNAIKWSNYQRPQHELSVSLELPKYVKLGDSVLLNATVSNTGLNDETDVELQLLMAYDVVDSVLLSELAAGTSHTLNYLWTPTTEGSYNVTGYVTPKSNEEYKLNNMVSVNLKVLAREITEVAVLNSWDVPSYFYGGWSNDFEPLVDALNVRDFYAQAVTNEEIVDGILSSFDVFVMVDNVPNELAVSNVTDFWSKGGGIVAFDSSICFLCYAGILPPESVAYNGYGFYWGYDTSSEARISIEHPITEGYAVGQIVSGASGDAEYWVDALAGTRAYPYFANLVEDLRMQNWAYVSAYEPPSAGKVVHIWDQNHWSNVGLQLMILNTMEWASQANRYEHDLAVSLDASAFVEIDDSTVLNATVLNKGSKNETNVELSLIIDDTVASDTTIPELPSGKYYTVSYTWTPTRRHISNISAYAPPVSGENYTRNNLMPKQVSVFYYTHSNESGRWVGGGYPMGWHSDDASWEYSLPFNFFFYGRSFDKIYISSNGLIAFNSPDSSLSNSIPELGRKLAIAPAWDDWVTFEPHDIYVQSNLTCVIIRWDVRHYGSDIEAHFEAILSADGIIQFDYLYNSGPFSATVGISNGEGHIIAEDADNFGAESLIFLPYRRDVAAYGIQASPAEVYSGQSVNLNATVGNEGDVSESFDVQVFYQNLALIPNAQTSVIASPSLPNEPHSGDAIWIEPSFVNLDSLSVGQTFNVTLWTNVTRENTLWQISIIYNKTRLKATNAEYTAGSSSQFYSGYTTVPVTPIIGGSVNDTHSYVLFGECLLGYLGEGRPAGFGSLCAIEFQILEKPYPEPVDYFELGREDTFVCDPNIDEIPITLYNGAYGSTTQPPPPPPPPNIIGTVTVHLDPGANTTIFLTWNTLGLPLGNYTLRVRAVPLAGETELDDNNFTDGIIMILWRHDVAVIELATPVRFIYPKQNFKTEVTVQNNGDEAENVSVVAYCNTSSSEILGAERLENLLPGETRTIELTIDTKNLTAGHHYLLTAAATIEEMDYNPSDNRHAGPTITIRFLGDINGDGKVDMRDIGVLARLFGVNAGDIEWNPDCDLNFDGRINLVDVAWAAKNFGKTMN